MQFGAFRGLRRALAVLLSIALLTLLLGGALAESYPFAGIITDDANLRRTADSSVNNVLVKIPKGAEITVKGAVGNFYCVIYAGKTGYVFKQYVRSGGSGADSGNSSTQADAPITYPCSAVTNDTVNLRKTRDIQSKRLASMPKGATVSVLGVQGNWAQVLYGTQSGYCLKEYLTMMPASTFTPAPSSAAPTLDPTTQSTSYTTLQGGSKGDQVVALQEALIELGFLTSSADGTYGTATAQAVMAFQRVNEYPITGLADPNLQAFLYNGKPLNNKGVKTEVRTLPAITGITIRLGDKGVLVRTVQARLQELGYYTGVISGLYDAATQTAVKSFQKKYGLSVDGVCGLETQEKLLDTNALSAHATATPAPTPTPTPLPPLVTPAGTVREGTRNADAQRVQKRLIDLGYLRGEADGWFGEKSVAALKAFQQKNNLNADGVAGPETIAVLFSYLAISVDYVPTAVPVSTVPPTTSVTATPEPITPENVVVIKQGVSGNAVLRLQQRLTLLGYYTAAMDGVCKADDAAAIRVFQKLNHLTVDGAAGYTTQTVLYSANAVAYNGTTNNSAISAMEPLRKGMTGTAVVMLQQRLIALGFLTGTADGVYGTKTAEAVYHFQRSSGLVRDGVAGAKTLAALYSGGTPQPSVAPTVAPTMQPATIQTALLRKGDASEDVKLLQSRLIALGYLTGAADGKFGVKTYEAVRAFQRANALTSDGIAGSKTLAALNQAGATATVPPAMILTPSPKPTAPEIKASNVIYEYWYSTVRSACKQYPYATVYDYSTGISWQVHMFSYGKHAEAEPLTAADTARMEQAFGGNTWTPKAVWVIFGDGTIRIASTHSMPHQVQHIRDNNFEGHLCIHFPRTQAQVTAIGPYATSHQAEVDRGWAETQLMAAE